MIFGVFVVLLSQDVLTDAIRQNLLTCGIDHEPEVMTGLVPLEKYPWVGILYYSYYGDVGESRAVTTVAFIQEEFVLAAAADVGPMPKNDFRKNARVLLGQDWHQGGYAVRNYVLHPEYEVTAHTVALVQLATSLRDPKIRPLCPPPRRLVNPEFHIVKFGEDYKILEKHVLAATHVPAFMCKEFYITTKLYAESMRPPHVTCALSDTHKLPCVWNAGALLVVRDVWGRWQLLGLGVRGAGCAAPSRYLDVMSYQDWIEDSMNKFQRITISKISNKKYVLRQGFTQTQRFGRCDPEEQKNVLYREAILLVTDNGQYQFMTYNMTIYDDVQFSCLILEVTNGSGVSEMRIKHWCNRESRGPACYSYEGSSFHISVFVIFAEQTQLHLIAYGEHVNMSLIDKQEWKWEEGTYYDDFNLERVEYRGPPDQTLFGFEPLDEAMWVPEYDVWSTTEFDNSSWSSTTPLPTKIIVDDAHRPDLVQPLEADTITPPDEETTTTTRRPGAKKTIRKRKFRKGPKLSGG